MAKKKNDASNDAKNVEIVKEKSKKTVEPKAKTNTVKNTETVEKKPAIKKVEVAEKSKEVKKTVAPKAKTDTVKNAETVEKKPTIKKVEVAEKPKEIKRIVAPKAKTDTVKNIKTVEKKPTIKKVEVAEKPKETKKTTAPKTKTNIAKNAEKIEAEIVKTIEKTPTKKNAPVAITKKSEKNKQEKNVNQEKIKSKSNKIKNDKITIENNKIEPVNNSKNNLAKPENTEVKTDVATTEIATQGMSKSARRRAKKKAKKLLKEQLAFSEKISNTSTENSSNENENSSNENTVSENVVSEKKTVDEKDVSNEPKVAKNIAKKNAPNNAQNNTKKNDKKTNNQKQKSSNDRNNDRRAGRKLNPQDQIPQSNKTAEILDALFGKAVNPIPFVDLSKLNEERKVKFVKSDTEIVPINSEKLLSPLEKKDPFFQNFYREIEKFLISEMLVESGSKVVVAVSGGVDSVVMFDVLANLSDKYRFAIYVVHYNHNLRGEASHKDEKFVRELAASYNVPYYWANGKVVQHAEKNGLSIEESARFLRYFFFERTVRTLKADFIATAHTLEDSTETFLLNLLRGTGLTGLSGIPSRRQFIKDTILIRPFLNVRKQKIIEYAEKRNLQWREDETNLQDKYTRNKIRLDLIPKLAKDYTPAIVEVINRSTKLIQGADRIIHDYVRTHLDSVIDDTANETVAIKVAFFKTFDEFIRGEMLQTILMKYFRMMPPSMKIIDRILKLENSEVGAICEISKSIFAIRDRQTIIITRKATPNKINQKIEKTGKYQIANMRFVLKEVTVEDIEYSENPKVEFLDFNSISQNLIVRNWEHNDEFNPLGMTGTMKVSDFLTNEKIPILDKPNILVLTTDTNEIIWVCKHRINNKFKITDNTQKVLRIEIKESRNR